MPWYGWLLIIIGLACIGTLFCYPLFAANQRPRIDEDEHRQAGIG
jgi:hypothetical protein